MQIPKKKTPAQKPQKPHEYIYQTVQFTTPISNKTLNKHLSHYAEYLEYGEKIFTQSRWDLTQSFSQTNMHQIFPYIAKAPCKELNIQRKSEYNVFRMISHVDFYRLQILELANNLLGNVQSVASLNCPKLKTLDLSKNQITNFKPLFKTVFTELIDLKIDHNTCYELSLARFFTNKKNQINFKYTSHKLTEQPIIVLLVDGKRQKTKSKKRVFTQDHGPIADLISFFVKLQNYKVTDKTMYLLDKRDDCQTTVLHKKKRTELCDTIVRKFTRYRTLKAFCKKFPLDNQQSSDSDYPINFQDAVDSLEGFEFRN